MDECNWTSAHKTPGPNLSATAWGRSPWISKKHSIDAWNQPLCATAIVFVLSSKCPAERSFFNMNAIQDSQSGWNEGCDKAGPRTRVESASQENQFQAEIGRMTYQGVETASLDSLPGADRNVCAEGSAQRNDCYGANSQTENENPKGYRRSQL